MNDQVAQTILEQIEAGYNFNFAGHKLSFLKMAGASEFIYSEDGIMFRVRGNKKVVIKLTEMDTYNLQVWAMKKKVEKFEFRGKSYNNVYRLPELVYEQGDVYFDELTDILARELKV